jgi:hypothetical protein
MGHLADHARPILITDSFAMAEPLLRAGRLNRDKRGPVLAFFERALDTRWQRVIRSGDITFINFDEHADSLFGLRTEPERRNALTDDFLL